MVRRKYQLTDFLSSSEDHNSDNSDSDNGVYSDQDELAEVARKIPKTANTLRSKSRGMQYESGIDWYPIIIITLE